MCIRDRFGGGRCIGGLRAQPLHIAAQFLANGFDGVIQIGLLHRLVVGIAGGVFGDPLTGEGAILDFGQHLAPVSYTHLATHI